MDEGCLMGPMMVDVWKACRGKVFSLRLRIGVSRENQNLESYQAVLNLDFVQRSKYGTPAVVCNPLNSKGLHVTLKHEIQ